MAETHEDPLVAGDTGEDAIVETSKANIVEAVKAPVAKSGKTPVAESGKAFVVEIREDSAAGSGKTAETEASNAVVVETGENTAAGTEEDHPVAEIREDQPAVMVCGNLQKQGNGEVEGAASAASSFAGCFQMATAEATDYSIKSLESGSAYIEKLRRAKSLDSAIQIQSDYARSAYAEFLAYLVKLSDLYCNLFKRGPTPIEKAAAKIEGVKA
jgi:hypothetical protein